MKTPKNQTPFDTYSKEYDAWFDTENGKEIFELEIEAIRILLDNKPIQGNWIEIGVGSGRFAQKLGIKNGIDIAKSAIDIAAQRGINAKVASAENLPYKDKTFDGALAVASFCFFQDKAKATKEIYRILKPKSLFIVGTIPATSPWGKLYIQKKKQGHKFYSLAEFFSSEQTIQIVSDAGFEFVDASSGLKESPNSKHFTQHPSKGIDEKAGFIAIKFIKK